MELGQEVDAVDATGQPVTPCARERLERCGAAEEVHLVGGQVGEDRPGEVVLDEGGLLVHRPDRAVHRVGGAARRRLVEQVQTGRPAVRVAREVPGVVRTERRVVDGPEQVGRLAGPEAELRRADHGAAELRPREVQLGVGVTADDEVEALVGGEQQLLEQLPGLGTVHVVQVVDHQDQIGRPLGQGIGQQHRIRPSRDPGSGTSHRGRDPPHQLVDGVVRRRVGPPPGDVHGRPARPMGERGRLPRPGRCHDRADPHLPDPIEAGEQAAAHQTVGARDADRGLTRRGRGWMTAQHDPVLGRQPGVLRARGGALGHGQLVMRCARHDATSPTPSGRGGPESREHGLWGPPSVYTLFAPLSGRYPELGVSRSPEAYLCRRAPSCDAASATSGPAVGGVEVAQRDDADARLEALDVRHRCGQALGAGLQLARGDDVRGAVVDRLAAEQDRLAGRALAERVSRPHPVADVEVGPRRLDDRQGQGLLAVGDGEVGGAADLLGEPAQHRCSDVAQHRLHRGREVQDAQADVQPRAGVAAYQTVLLERGHQAVDDRAVDLEPVGELGHRQPSGGAGQHREHPQPAVQGL